MSYSKSSYGFHFSPLGVLFTLLALCISDVRAQEPAPGGRIVAGRPPLYTFKRDIDPLTWIEWGTKPIFRSAESGWIHKLATRPPAPEKTSGIRFGIGDVGISSGFGPQVTFFHKDLFGRGIDVEVPLVYTYNRYEVYQFNATVPVMTQSPVGKLTFDVVTAYRSRASDDMFTLGNQSPLGAESQIRTVSREAAAGFSVRLNDKWKAGVHEKYRNVGVTNPLFGKSAQTSLRAFDIPALLTGAVLRATALTVDHDTQDQEHMPAKGGRQHVEVSVNDSVDKGGFAYWKYHLAFQHFFPLTDDRRTVIALRGFAETNQNKAGTNVPWLDMPTVGSWDTLRGFENFRFRDKSAMALTAEYRYRIWRNMDWGFFLDGGQVAPRLRDFGLDRFHAGYGLRVFILPKLTFPVAIDVAHSNEKWGLYVNFNTTF